MISLLPSPTKTRAAANRLEILSKVETAATVKAATVKAATVKAATVKAATVKAATVKAATVKAATVKIGNPTVSRQSGKARQSGEARQSATGTLPRGRSRSKPATEGRLARAKATSSVDIVEEILPGRRSAKVVEAGLKVASGRRRLPGPSAKGVTTSPAGQRQSGQRQSGQRQSGQRQAQAVRPSTARPNHPRTLAALATGPGRDTKLENVRGFAAEMLGVALVFACFLTAAVML